MSRDDFGKPSTAAIVGTFIAIAGVVIGLFTVVFDSWYSIDQTERGVLLRNGAVIGVAQPGLGGKLPIIDDVQKISVKTVTFTWDKMEAYSFDQQPANLRVSVTLRTAPDKVGELYSRFGTLDAAVKTIIGPVVHQQVKIVFGQYNAARTIQDRAQLNIKIRTAIEEALRGDQMIVIESVQLENIEFSSAYVQSIEQRMLAEVEVQKLQQNAEREKVQAQIVVTQAMAAANATKAKAEAEAAAIRLRGDAEAAAIEARGKALSTNPRIIELVQAERWSGNTPHTMVPGGAVPFLSLSTASK